MMLRLILSLAVCYVVLTIGSREAGAFWGRTINQGNELYGQGDYHGSLAKYEEAYTKDEHSGIVNFNLGSAYYKEGSYDKALEHFRRALLGEDGSIKEKAYYNAGNSLYQRAIAVKQSKPQAAIPILEQALTEYDKALALEPGDEDAKFNKSFVEQKLKELKEQLKARENQKGQEPQGSQVPQQPRKQEGTDQSASKEVDQQEQSKSAHEKSQDENQSAQGDNKNDGARQEDVETALDDRDAEQQEKLEDAPREDEESMKESQKKDESNGFRNSEDAKTSAEMNTVGERVLAGGEDLSPQEVTRQEAQMLIEQYLQKEQPKGLLSIMPRDLQGQVVEKDW